jgi:hypothetical protein
LEVDEEEEEELELESKMLDEKLKERGDSLEDQSNYFMERGFGLGIPDVEAVLGEKDEFKATDEALKDEKIQENNVQPSKDDHQDGPEADRAEMMTTFKGQVAEPNGSPLTIQDDVHAEDSQLGLALEDSKEVPEQSQNSPTPEAVQEKETEDQEHEHHERVLVESNEEKVSQQQPEPQLAQPVPEAVERQGPPEANAFSREAEEVNKDTSPASRSQGQESPSVANGGKSATNPEAQTHESAPFPPVMEAPPPADAVGQEPAQQNKEEGESVKDVVEVHNGDNVAEAVAAEKKQTEGMSGEVNLLPVQSMPPREQTNEREPEDSQRPPLKAPTPDPVVQQRSESEAALIHGSDGQNEAEPDLAALVDAMRREADQVRKEWDQGSQLDIDFPALDAVEAEPQSNRDYSDAFDAIPEDFSSYAFSPTLGEPLPERKESGRPELKPPEVVSPQQEFSLTPDRTIIDAVDFGEKRAQQAEEAQPPPHIEPLLSQSSPEVQTHQAAQSMIKERLEHPDNRVIIDGVDLMGDLKAAMTKEAPRETNKTLKMCEDNEVYIVEGDKTLLLTNNRVAKDINAIQETERNLLLQLQRQDKVIDLLKQRLNYSETQMDESMRVLNAQVSFDLKIESHRK